MRKILLLRKKLDLRDQGQICKNNTFAECSDFIGARTASLKSEQISDYEYASKILYLQVYSNGKVWLEIKRKIFLYTFFHYALY